MSEQRPDPASPAVKHTVTTPPDEALKYWTADKQRKAKPAPMPHVDAPQPGKKSAPHSPQTPDAHKS